MLVVDIETQILHILFDFNCFEPILQQYQFIIDGISFGTSIECKLSIYARKSFQLM